MVDRDHPGLDLSEEEYCKFADEILFELNPQAYLFFMLEDMSRLHSEITTTDTASLLNMTRATYIKEEPNYGYKVRFNPRTVQEISR